MEGQWIGKVQNKKTGAVPTLYVGGTREQSKRSCGSCELLKRNNPEDKAECYSQHGTPAMAHAQILKTYKLNPGRYSFDNAMGDRESRARIARFGSIGDPAAIARDKLNRWFNRVREQNMRVVGYTSQFNKPENKWLSSHFMASAKSIEEADDLVAKGWRATVVVKPNFKPQRSPAGNFIILCPAIAADRQGKTITCNDTGKGEECKFCDAQEEGPIVGFPNHGPGARKELLRVAIEAPTKREAIAQFKTLHTDRMAVGVKRPKHGSVDGWWIVSSVAA
jgi:hypothetical protein